MTLANGLIVEEIVYSDTAPLRALLNGQPLESVARIPTTDSQ